MRLYTMTKSHFFFVTFTFAMVYLVLVLIGLAGPHIIENTSHNTSLSADAIDTIRSPPLTPFNQQLWLKAKVIADVHSGEVIQPVTIGVLIRGLAEDADALSQDLGPEHNRTRRLHCTNQACDPILLLHIPTPSLPRYVMTVRWQGLGGVPASHIVYTCLTYNPAFTQLQIWVRFCFVLVTFVFTCWFSHSLHTFSVRDWSQEQRCIAVLLPLLLLYDNPLYPLIFLTSSSAPYLVDAIVQTTFYSALMYTWICTYHALRQTRRSFLAFYLPKLLLVGTIWACIVLLICWQARHEASDPTYNYRTDMGHFRVFEVLFLVLSAVYVVMFLYHLIRSFIELRSMPYFDIRLQAMTVLTLTVLAVTIVIYSLRFGATALKEDFVADLSTTFNSSIEFTAFYGLLNIYVYSLAYVYSPSPTAMTESNFRDNPALSMLNDSDDDVIYGSESMERTALTSSRAEDDL